MKFYRTKENNLINLDRVNLIYIDPEKKTYNVSFENGITYEIPELEKEDIDKIMDYNDYLLK